MISIEQSKRLEAAQQFRLQAEKLGFSILHDTGTYTFRIQDRESNREMVAIVLSTTFDFYEYRLHCSTPSRKTFPEILIVQEHNAVAPLPVLSLKEGRLYDPGVVAQGWKEREQRIRRNRAESYMFCSRLLLSEREALIELKAMKPRTRQWYEAKLRTYLTRKRGRPWNN